MGINDFIEELRQAILVRSIGHHLVDTLAFVHEVAERLEDDPVFGEFEPAEYIGSASSKKEIRLHGFTRLDESDGSIGLVIGKWEEISTPQSLLTANVVQLSGWLEAFVRESIDKNLFERINEANPAYELARFLNEERHKISRIRLHILTNLSLSSRFKEELTGDVAGIPFERHIWDLDRIQAIFESSREREAVEIDLREGFNSNFIPCIKASDGGGLDAYLCVIKGELLADLFDRYGSRLLEGNVRSFLGMKGGVNKGIRNTIKKEPELFFPYNNGISATASNVVIEIINGESVITGLVDLQIVNGGQTTASVLNARKKEKLVLDKVYVQMKLTRVEKSVADELIPHIAEFANTQNKVAVADFFANHPFHIKMQAISRRLLTPAKAGETISSKWFYERSRGQYQNERLYLTQSQKNAFDREYPKNQLINKTDLAKFDNTWNLKPQWASLGAQKSFGRFAKQFESKDEEMSDIEYWEKISDQYGDFFYKKMVSIAILWKTMESIVDEAKTSWYEGGYRANIVTYTLSKLLDTYRKQSLELDTEEIWKNQKINGSMKDYLNRLAQTIQESIINPQMGISNIGEWCKRDACWNKVSDLNVPQPPREFAITKDAFKDQAKAGTKEGEMDNGINNQANTFALMESGYWAQLNNWHQLRDVFSLGEVNLISKASTQAGFFKITSDRDFLKLVSLKRRAEEEGFNFNI